jgi:hypothetical protein
MIKSARLVILLFSLLLAGCSSASAPSTPAATFGPTGSAGAGVPNFRHIFVLLMENEEYGGVIGNSAAPYITSLARQYAQAHNFNCTSHPS